ncbi:universal stress protein [Salinarimonas sp.]|uniref:universal stress protein n=1 Tax=Salinarimonas sp. TaxID=2766526 RepID=UPI0032D8CC3E
MDRILVATDGSDHADRAVDLAGALAGRFGAELIVLHVVPRTALTPGERELIETEYAHELASRMHRRDPTLDPRLTPASFLDREADITEDLRGIVGARLIEAAEERAGKAGATRVRGLIAHGDPARIILQTAEGEQADAIVVGSRGLGDWRALLLGSVSHKVAQLASASVITVR